VDAGLNFKPCKVQLAYVISLLILLLQFCFGKLCGNLLTPKNLEYSGSA